MAELPPPPAPTFTTAEHRLELTQLVADLKSVFGSHWFGASVLDLIAEKLYDRGVRSRLHAPVRTRDRIHFTADPETGFFVLTEPGEYELIMEATEPPDISAFDPTRPVAGPQMLVRLVKRGDLQQMSEVPGHVDRAPAAVDRPLPEGVQRVIRFVHLLQANGWKPGDRVFVFAGVPGRASSVQLIDLQAVLAEIPDVAPRYPTIWAYEQACRTIRERDARIEKALGILASMPMNDENDVRDQREALSMALQFRASSAVPATEEDKSEVTRALEFAEQQDHGWVPVEPVKALAAEVRHLRVLGDTLAADIDAETRCPNCEHTTSLHADNGTGCQFTVSDVHMGLSANCPCTLDARNEQKVIDGE